MILRSWFPFNVQVHTGGRLVYVAYAIQLCVMWMGMIIVPSWHTLMVALMTNAIIGLRQLNAQLRQPLALEQEAATATATRSIEQRLRPSADARMYAHLRDCMEKLQRVRSNVKDLEALMRPFIFLDFMVFSVLLCALLFQASRVSECGQLWWLFEVQIVSICFFAGCCCVFNDAHSR